MPIYNAPIQDNLFLLNDVFHIDQHTGIPGYADMTPDIVEATLNEAAKLSEQVLTPLNRIGDEEGCRRHDDGSVTTPKGFKEAFKQFADGGWMGMSAPAEFGGQELPVILSGIVGEFLASSNLAFMMFSVLTQGATSALLDHASPEQKSLYVPNMVAGKWTGTMNLTEAHSGTDLGLLRTKAKLAGGRELPYHRIEGLHFRRRARHVGEHHPSRSRQDRGRTRRREGDIALRRSEIHSERRWIAGRQQQRLLRLNRTQNGNSRKLHLRHEFR